MLKASADGDAAALAGEIRALADVAANPQMRQFADSPKIDVDAGLRRCSPASRGTPSGAPLSDAGEEPAAHGDRQRPPRRAARDRARSSRRCVDARSGVSQATIESAFPIDAAQLAEVKAAMERRFGSKLETSVVVVPELIGGVRVIVGDEVLDTSIRARLEQMKAALSAA